MPEVMLQFIAVILMGIEMLVFDLPSRASDSRNRRHILSRYLKIGDPAIVVNHFAFFVSLQPGGQTNWSAEGWRWGAGGTVMSLFVEAFPCVGQSRCTLG